MKCVNLIPAPRLLAKQRRHHVRRCTAACVAWAVASVLAVGVCQAVWRSGEDPQTDERVAAADEDVRRTDRAIADAKAKLAVAQSTLRANEAIANQPDWRILLAVLAREVKQDVVLQSCHVRPVGAAAPNEPRRPGAGPVAQPGPTPVAPPVEGVPFVLEANGMAETLAAAHRFVGDLERTGLFARVTLKDTAREPFPVGKVTEAIRFKLECSLEEPAGGAPGSATAAIDRQ